jgi:hypothetical protein
MDDFSAEEACGDSWRENVSALESIKLLPERLVGPWGRYSSERAGRDASCRDLC